MSVTLPLHPAAAASLVAWHQLVASREPQKLPPLLHPDAMFRSPMAFKPYQGAMIVAVVLRTALATFEDFRYHRELASADGLNVVLEFSARVGDKQLKGIDLIRFDEAGKIVEFEVMIRPFSGLQALGEEMAKRLAPYLPPAKSAGGA